MILEKILEQDRRLRGLHLQLQRESYYNPAITDKFSGYLDDYCNYTGIDAADAQYSYSNFVRLYVDNLKSFEMTGLYPADRGEKHSFSRQDYDLALILSVFFEKVRHCIFSKTYESYRSLKADELLLYVGLGPGLELDLLSAKAQVEAYDLSIAPFVRRRFSHYNLIEELFVEKKNNYTRIYCLELLEHVPTPQELIKHMAASLVTGGRLYFTTASDMPQFDHLINFTGLDLSTCIGESGLKILEQTDLWHNYKKAHNKWYTCQKL